MSSWHSYGKIYSLGHPSIVDLFDGEVTIEEKVDGSQFSFGVFNNEIKVRSRKQIFSVYDHEGLFEEACQVVKKIAPLLQQNWTYRGEYLKKLRHNGLQYNRIPNNHIILWDINIDTENYLTRERLEKEAKALDLEVVPLLYKGKIKNKKQLEKFFKLTSILGGQKIEGVVIKNLEKFGRDGKPLRGKLVSDEFKEVQKKYWKKDNPSKTDVLNNLIEEYRVPARWNKALSHLKEDGKITNEMKDISLLLKEVKKDLNEECKEEVCEKLWQWFREDFLRKATKGLPEWYKNLLVEKQFENK